MLGVSLVLKLITVIVFSVALCRIAWLLNKLKKFGYVQSRAILRLHIACCFFDLIYNIVASLIHLELFSNSIHYSESGDTSKDTYIYSINPEKVSIGLIIYQSYGVLNQCMMLIVCYNIWKYIRGIQEERAAT